MNNELNYDKLREMIARCEWTFAKTMPFAPHEYIVRDGCPLTDEEFVYFVDMQRRFGVKERWGKYNNPYLYIDDYKYWTMGASYDETTVINRAKACVVDDAHIQYEGMKEAESYEYIDEYIHKKLGLKPDDKGYNINLLSGRLDELDACVNHLRRIRKKYSCELMKEWSQRLSKDFPNNKKVEELGPASIIYTGIALPYKDISDAIAIRIEIAGKSLYYGLTYMPEIKTMRNELQKALSFINDGNEFTQGSDWMYYKYTSFEDGYECLRQLVVRMINYVKDIPLAVRNAALFPFEIVLLGQFNGKDVYGYSNSGLDDGRGIGLPHFILFDGLKAECVFDLPGKEWDYFWNLNKQIIDNERNNGNDI